MAGWANRVRNHSLEMLRLIKLDAMDYMSYTVISRLSYVPGQQLIAAHSLHVAVTTAEMEDVLLMVSG